MSTIAQEALAPHPHVAAAKAAIVAAVRSFIETRANLNKKDYSSQSELWRHQRKVLRDKRDAEKLLSYVEAQEEVTPQALELAFQRANGGRLRLVQANGKTSITLLGLDGAEAPNLHKLTFRAAACKVLAWAIWESHHAQQGPAQYNASKASLAKHFPRQMFNRWF